MKLRLLLLACLSCSTTALAAAELSEKDYFTELPEVLTVTRLAQPLNETPGAVTIIDRETIRRSGARELADVLRLVPGYMVSGFNGANPIAVYHAPIDEFGARNLVLIDGRAVYSSYYQGDTHFGMMGVMLEDIERIEVLRGANSAAYGANAMFGVINIITRHTADTHGVEISMTGGEGGINDNQARIGWGNETASYRLSTGRRSDSGYINANDDKIVSQLQFRGDLRLAKDQDLMLEAGVAHLSSGNGFPLGTTYNDVGGNALRETYWHDYFLHGQWRRQLSSTDEIKLTASYDEEAIHDTFNHATYGLDVSSSGRGRRFNLELQHQIGINSQLRAVWGGGYKYEAAWSPALYATNDAISAHEERLFGNLEWRPHKQWVINAGGFWGNHSWVGQYFSPRLMANFLITPDHTVRLGVTESSRMPTLFELAADVRYVFSPTAPFPYSLFSTPSNPYRFYAARGNAGPEKLYSQEIGYFGNFHEMRMTLDVRGYIERMRDRVDRIDYVIPGNLYLSKDFANAEGFTIHGIEYQLRWKPFEKTELWLNQNFQSILWDKVTTNNLPPAGVTTVALFQKLPYDLDLSLMYQSIDAMTWRGASEKLPARHRVDARLALPFRIGSTRAEASFTVQATNGNYQEFLPSQGFTFERRAYGTLRLEF